MRELDNEYVGVGEARNIEKCRYENLMQLVAEGYVGTMTRPGRKKPGYCRRDLERLGQVRKVVPARHVVMPVATSP